MFCKVFFPYFVKFFARNHIVPYHILQSALTVLEYVQYFRSVYAEFNMKLQMKKFMDKDFLLETKTAQKLFEACKNESLWDYHCHLIPSQIAENKKFKNLTEIWLGGDHYKWRQMRTYGVTRRASGKDSSPARPS